MRFTVEGADAKTGDERTVIISATDSRDAEKEARGMGILISRVTPRHEADGMSEPLASQVAAKTMSLKAAAVEINAPDYAALRTMSHVFFMFACIGYALCVACLIATAVLIAITIRTKDDDIKQFAIYAALASLGAIINGIINHGVSVFLLAFRDLVRNSFR